MTVARFIADVSLRIVYIRILSMPKSKIFIVLSVLFLLLLLSIVITLLIGAVPLPWSNVREAFLHLMQTQTTGDEPMAAVILWQIRLPRVLLAALVGASLGVSGAAMQGLFRNPLADPGLIGVSAGAALGASIAIVLGSAWLNSLLPILQAWSVAMGAFIGSMVVTFFVYRLASSHGKTEVATLLLAGVAIQAMAGAAIGLLTYIANDTQLRDLTFWSMGSLGGAKWQQLQLLALVLLPCCLLLMLCGRSLNALLLGEYEAGHLGIKVERIKVYLVILTALAVGVAVSATGMIGFIGLVVPHLIRLAFGANHYLLLPASALLGAVLLLWADTLARTIVSPAELPIGILTAILGAPFFLYLLMQQRGRFKL